MAVFISKEEILAGVREIPAAQGAQAAGSSPLSVIGSAGSPLGGGTGLDQLERILTQINGIVTQVHNIRNNPTTKAIMGTAQASAMAGAPAQFIESAPTARPPGMSMQPAPAVLEAKKEAKAMKNEINEEGVKEFIDSVINELDSSPQIKELKLGDAITGYKVFANKRTEFQERAIIRFKEWLPKLVKQVE